MARTKLAAYLDTTVGLQQMEDFRSNFEKRLEVQKIGYFAQEFGANLGYNFGWYHYGPYSTKLADDAYSLALLKESGVKLMTNFPQLPSQRELSTFLKEIDRMASRTKETPGHWLELTASLHYIMKYSYPPVRNRRAAMYELRKVKPHFTSSEITEAYGILKRQKLL